MQILCVLKELLSLYIQSYPKYEVKSTIAKEEYTFVLIIQVEHLYVNRNDSKEEHVLLLCVIYFNGKM